MTIANLPEGVIADRISLPSAVGRHEYELVDQKIYRGPRPGAKHCVVVRAAPGFVFQYNITTNSFIPKRPNGVRTVVVKFQVTTDEERKFVDSVKGHHTVVSVSEV